MGDIVQLRRKPTSPSQGDTPAGAFVFGNVRFYYYTKPSRLRIFLVEWLLDWEWKDIDATLYQQFKLKGSL